MSSVAREAVGNFRKAGTAAPPLALICCDGTKPSAVPTKAMRCNAAMAHRFVLDWKSYVITNKRRRPRFSPLEPALGFTGLYSHDPTGTSFWRR